MAPKRKSDDNNTQEARILPPYCIMREDIVISGMSGIFPDSFDLNELAKNLYAGTNCVTGSFPRWPPGYLGLPKYTGTIPYNLKGFDSEYFGYSPEECFSLDFQLRFLLEKTHEAIVDAGINPDTLRGSRTGFFLASSVDETNLVGFDANNVHGVLQLHAARMPNAFDFRGPVGNIDVACGSSLTALHQAMVALRTGDCDQAVIAAANICIFPGTAMMFHDMSMTSQECKCKAFDASADGYARSEALAVIILQKRKDAKRIYSIIRHTRVNADGSKPEGITFPKAETQAMLIKATYDECGVDPLKVKYMESHATGTKAGDPIECIAMSKAMRKGKQSEYGPLWVGALKSNIGHTEAASGLCAIAKVIISYENKLIPKNIHINVLNPDIPELHDGSLLPLTENTPFEGGIVSVNNFGFGGANAHAILESVVNEPTEECFKIADKIPRLVLMCGRTLEAVNHAFDHIQSDRSKITRGFLGLLNDVSRQEKRVYKGMPFRGSMILTNDGENEPPYQIGQTFLSNSQRPLWYIFTGMGSQWPSMAKTLMGCDVFADTIRRLSRVLQPYNIDLIQLLTSNNSAPLSRPIGCFVTIAAVQIALVDLLNYLGLKPDGMIGHSIGEIGCAYADGALTAEQTILAAYWRGKCIEESVPDRGLMVAVGLSWDEVKKRCPPGIVAACNNSAESVTVAGPYTITAAFMTKLRKENIFAKEVDSCGVPFHSPYMNAIEPSLSAALKSIGIKSKPRTERWISTSAGDSSPADVNYYVNNLIKPVTFYEAISRIPKDACVIELSPHSLFSAAIKDTLGSDVKFISSMRKNGTIMNLLSAIGQLYEHGYNPLIEKLYPAVEYPVPRGTPFISPLIKWDHSVEHYVPDYDNYCQEGEKIRKTWKIKVRDRQHESLNGHVIEGRLLYPATGYLLLTWKTLANLYGVKYDQLPVQFENVIFKRATIMPKDREVTFDVYFMEASGNFEIVESNQVCVSGKCIVPNLRDPMGIMKFGFILDEELKREKENKNRKIMNSKDVYKELRIRGYDYGPTFQGVQSATANGSHGKVKWCGDWIAFADAMLQIGILSKSHRGLCLPTGIELLRCDPRIMHLGDDERIIDVAYDSKTNIGYSNGIEMRGMRTTSAPRKIAADVTLEEYLFIPNHETMAIDDETKSEFNEYIAACQSLALQIEQRLGKAVKAPILDADIHKYLDSESNKYTVIKILNEIKQKASPENYWQLMDAAIKENAQNLTEDMILNCTIHCERFSQPLISVFLDNYHSRVEVLELNMGGNVITPHFMDMMKLQVQDLRCHFTIAHPDKDNLKDIPQVNVTPLNLTNFKMGIPGDVQKSELNAIVIIRDSTLCRFTDAENDDPCLALEQAYATLNDNGFILAFLKCKDLPFDRLLYRNVIDYSKRCADFIAKAEQLNLITICKKFDSISTMGLLFQKKNLTAVTKRHIINVKSDRFEWVEEYKRIQSTLKPNEQIWLLTNEKHSGVLGMVNCLRSEPGGDYIRCLYNEQMKDLKIPPEIIKSDLQQNVFRDGKWGIFTHLKMENDNYQLRPAQHAYVNVKNKGDLSSFSWFEAQHKYWPITRKNSEILVNVYYAPLNFRDIMCATGRLSADAIPGGLNIEDGILGLEFAGMDENKNRVMGMVAGRGMATTVVVPDPDFVWPIPANWTMEEACTVPCVYATSYYALMIRAKLKEGESVLIHAGSGGVGLSAINICLSMNCEVFTTVGTPEKREFIKKQFPQLKDDHILNSRDIKFEPEVLQMTNGRGVDVVLNSLSEEKLLASVRCLAPNGRFCEIGKFDLSIDSPLDLSSVVQNKTFHGVLLDAFFDFENLPPLLRSQKKLLQKYIDEGIKKGVVKPLHRTIFDKECVEDAFRFMSTGKHMGKVVLKMRDENVPETKPLTVMAIPRTVFHPQKCVIITGGLGGFGLEIAQWAVERGAKKLILTSRSGPKEPYQFYAIERMEKMGADITIWKGKGASEKEIQNLMQTAADIAPIGGIFHLAMIISDALMENQTIENFTIAANTKISQAHYLDQISRKMCPQLDYFVTFSSIVSGKGNAGQANYAFGNSACERVCESRRSDGFPGLSIQWGAIGDVGFVAETMKTDSIAGTLIQRIPSCLTILDRFLQSNGTVLGSRVRDDDGSKSAAGSANIMSQIAHILGINDPSKIDTKSRLIDLGMDSLMGVEIKLTLERDYNRNLSTQEIRNLTIEDLINLQTEAPKEKEDIVVSEESNDNADIDLTVLPTEPIVQLNTVKLGKPIFFLPSSEEQFHLLEPVAQKIMRPVFGVNWTEDFNKMSNMQIVGAKWLRVIESIEKMAEYDILGYSFGGVAAFEMALQLQKRGRKLKNLIMLDSSPQLMAAYGAAAKGSEASSSSDDKIHTEVLLGFAMRMTRINYDDSKRKLLSCKTPEERYSIAAKLIKETGIKMEEKSLIALLQAFWVKSHLADKYQITDKYNGNVMLIRASESGVVKGCDILSENDYGISKVINGNCDVVILDGDHKGFIKNNNDQLAAIINKIK